MITDLPDDILIHIVKYVKADDLLQLNMIKQFRQLFKEYYGDSRIKLVDYTSVIDMSKHTDLILKYKFLPMKLTATNDTNIMKYIHEFIGNNMLDYIFDCSIVSVRFILQLPMFTQLEKICISDCARLTNIDSIIDAKDVEIHSCTLIQTLPIFTQLEKIRISDCYRLTNIDSIIDAKDVEIHSCLLITTLPKFTQLEKICISDCARLTNIDSIIDAKDVLLNNSTIITTLPMFTQLEKICIQSCYNLSNIDSIINAKDVTLAWCPLITILPKFIQLEKIDTYFCPQLIKPSFIPWHKYLCAIVLIYLIRNK
jgi:hypothetical protein